MESNNSFNARLLFLSKWVLDTDKVRRTPTYTLQRYLGESPILYKKGRGGRIYFYYKPNISSSPDAPAINLQGRDSINLTGLRFLTKDGWRLEESVAYGEASQVATFANGNVNFMYGHRADAYIFKLGKYVPFDYGRDTCIMKVPSVIWWLILSDERLRAKQYAKALLTGLLDSELEELERRGVLRQYDTKNNTPTSQGGNPVFNLF